MSSSGAPCRNVDLRAPNLGASDKILPRLGKQALGGCGARLQSVQPHVQAVAFGLVLLFGFIKRSVEPSALRVGFCKARLDLTELSAGRG
jgi:hypothetical protein